jgi:dTDP-glucose pyrophosphorylase
VTPASDGGVPDGKLERSPAWHRALLPATATVQDAIRNLDETALQIALVVSGDGTLIGTITDGDIRRALLRGLGLDSPLDSVTFREALVVPSQLPRETVLSLMQANEIHALPVVDQSRRVAGLHLLRELLAPVKRSNLMVIMAGGEGTRLRPQTEHCPKPLLPVGGKPLLEHVIVAAERQGFRQFVIAVRYLGHLIEEYFGDGSAWRVNIDYVREETALGTAGALALLDPTPSGAFVVSNGDVLTDIRYGELLDFHCHHNAAATMAVRQHEWQNPYGVVSTEGVDITGFTEKPITRSHVNAGIYVLEPGVLDALPSGERCDMTALFERVRLRNQRTVVYPMHEPWFDLGLPADLARARGRADEKSERRVDSDVLSIGEKQ